MDIYNKNKLLQDFYTKCHYTKYHYTKLKKSKTRTKNEQLGKK